MDKFKTIDRHIEPEMTVYPVRIENAQLDFIRRIAREKDRTRQSLIREAISQWIRRQPR